MGIDLIEEDIDWYKFNSILKKIILNERSLMNKIIEFRTYQKPSSNSKTIEANIHKEKMRLKSEYMLPQRPKKIENNTNKLWNFLERGGNNE